MIPFFPASCLVQVPYVVKFIRVILKCRYRFFKHLYLHLQQYKVQPNENNIILIVALKVLSTDTSFIKLSTLEFNFHYRFSSHHL